MRPTLYADLVPTWVDAGGAIRGPAGDGAVAWVARDDVADVVTRLMLPPPASAFARPSGPLTVTGPAALTLADTASIVGAATHRSVRYEPESLTAARASRLAGCPAPPAWAVEGWITSYAAIAAGELAMVTDAVSAYAGHEPVALADLLWSFDLE